MFQTVQMLDLQEQKRLKMILLVHILDHLEHRKGRKEVKRMRGEMWRERRTGRRRKMD